MATNYFKDNIRYLRKINHLTQKQLADYIGKTPNCISNWEQGLRQPIVADCVKVCERFNVDFYDLINTDLRQSYNFDANTYREKELLTVFRNLTHDQQDAIITMMKSMVK